MIEMIIIWLGISIVLFFISDIFMAFITLSFPTYSLRLIAMLGGGITLGALAALFDYRFYFLTVILAVVLFRRFRRLHVQTKSDISTTMIVAMPSILFLLFVTITSYLFGAQICNEEYECSPLFFEPFVCWNHCM